MLQRPEHKSVIRLRDHVFMVSKVRQLVLDTCTGILAPGKACLQLPEYGWFPRSEKEPACFRDALPAPVELHLNYVSSPDPDSDWSKKAVEEGSAFMREMAGMSSRRTVDSWTLPLGFVSVPIFTVHIMHLLGNLHKEATLFEKSRYTSLSHWAYKWRGRSYHRDVVTLLALGISAQRTMVKKSTASHPDAVRGFLYS